MATATDFLHFAIEDALIVGITVCGRGAARLPGVNNESRLHHRRTLIEQGELSLQ